MEFKGTKGKWSFVAGNPNQLTVVKIGNAHEFELEINGKNRIKEEIANALLISKAPEMLEMLNEAVNVLRDGMRTNSKKELADKIEQLIKEATEL
jgi:hypothetical protein